MWNYKLNYKLIFVAFVITLGLTLGIAFIPDEDAPVQEVTVTTMPESVTELTTESATTVPVPEPPIIVSWEEIPLEAELQHHIVELCTQHDIPPAIVFAVCWRETKYTVNTIGDDGNSYGLMQVQPKWHYERMSELGATDLLNPYQNTAVGVDYLSELIERYNGNIYAAVVAYNRGSFNGTITEYAKSVMSEAERIETMIMEV